jgi:hypothetical protein
VWIRARYLQVLHREPAAATLAWRTSVVDAGGTLADLVVALAASDEAHRLAGGTDADWVDQLYRDLLGRSVDDAALVHWLAALVSGTQDRAGVVRAVYRSGESRIVRARGLYSSLLDRAADPGGLAWWGDRLRRIDDLDATGEIVAGSEYFALAQV